MSQAARCAIYTRKSSDEGLEQSFNSLDAQREAGEAYVLSQGHEGWKLLPARYDDGGFSGATIERPGLRKLLDDVDGGLVDVIVVYKIDRLTRSLADFARIVELFDKRKVSFVSVTQAFNTTSSMGRLTLNVLLSFAQFEREVTGERIRDKIAASKKKGMWMGGYPPLGYDPPEPRARILRVNPNEASLVHHIFERYGALGSVFSLQNELHSTGITSKEHITLNGKKLGGKQFSRGALFHLLRNHIYIGKIVHKGEIYEGGHDGIIPISLFASVQARLDRQARRRSQSSERRVIRSLLQGKLFNADGTLMTPTFSQGRGRRIYRYYISTSEKYPLSPTTDAKVKRVPAGETERIVLDALHRWLPHVRTPLDELRAVTIVDTGFEIEMCGAQAAYVRPRLIAGEYIITNLPDRCRVFHPVATPSRSDRRLTVLSLQSAPRPDSPLIKALRKAHRMVARDRSGLPVIASSPSSPYDRKILRLAFLAPDIQRDILEGRHPRSLNLEQLIQMNIPFEWQEQRQALGWPTSV